MNKDIPTFAKSAKILEDKSALRAGRLTTLFGFGPTEEDIKSMTVIARSMATVIDNLVESEKRVYARLNADTTINGDSGGPAFTEYNGSQVVLGILSCSSGVDGQALYESVPHYIDWIKSAAAELQAEIR